VIERKEREGETQASQIKAKENLGLVCLLESGFLLESAFRESKFQKNKLFFDVW